MTTTRSRTATTVGIDVLDGRVHVRLTPIQHERPSLLLVHGLGECNQCFDEAFGHNALTEFNLIAPDLLGFGQSTAADSGDYRLEAHIRRLWYLLDALQLERVAVLGHSMGADIATLMTVADKDNRVVALVNIEGDLTPADLFISNKASEAAGANQFEQWFLDFRENTVLKEWAPARSSCRRYYESLLACRTEAFRDSAISLFEANRTATDEGACTTGHEFCKIRIPKVFCWGTASVSPTTQDFIHRSRILHHAFDNAGHWPMIDSAAEFYPFLSTFLAR